MCRCAGCSRIGRQCYVECERHWVIFLVTVSATATSELTIDAPSKSACSLMPPILLWTHSRASLRWVRERNHHPRTRIGRPRSERAALALAPVRVHRGTPFVALVVVAMWPLWRVEVSVNRLHVQTKFQWAPRADEAEQIALTSVGTRVRPVTAYGKPATLLPSLLPKAAC